MAQTKVYGNTVGHWKAEYTLDTSFNNTSATIQIQNAGFRSTGWGFQLTGLGYNVCIKDDHTTDPPAGNVSLGTGSTGISVFVSSKSLTINKTHNEQKIYTGIWIGNYTSYESGESYGEYYVTVPAKTSYTISYNANGGTGAPSAQTKWYGEDLTLSSTKPTRAKHVFKGWATSQANANAGTVAVQPGVKYPGGNAAATYYAVWQPYYTITYNANQGSGAPAAQTKYAGQTLKLSTTKPTRSGYRFLGWNTSSSATTANSTYAPGATLAANSVSSDITLYAIWVLQCKVTYNANNHGTAPAAITVDKGTEITLGTISATGYRFDGWYTAASGGNRCGTQASNYTKYTPTASITIYAHWTQFWSVNYNANGGTGAPAAQTKFYNTSLTLSTTRPTRSGYTFVRWNTKADNTGTGYNPGGPYTGNAAITLYAIWSINYTAPKITSLSAFRTTNATSTNTDPSSNYVRVSFKWSVDSTVSNNKAKTLRVRYKTGSENWVSPSELTTSSTATSGTTSFNFIPQILNSNGTIKIDSADANWTIEVYVLDNTDNSNNNITRTITVGLPVIPIDIDNQGRNLGLLYPAISNNAIAIGGPLRLFNNSYITINSSMLTSGTPVSADTSGYGMSFHDSADKTIGYVTPIFYSNGDQGTQVYTQRVVSGTTIWNGFSLRIGSDGTRKVAVSEAAPWRSALGVVAKAGDTITGTLTLSRRTDAEGTADNKPALIVGGTSSQSHLELDDNEIMAKADGTTVAALYINNNGGMVQFGDSIRSINRDMDNTATSLSNSQFRTYGVVDNNSKFLSYLQTAQRTDGSVDVTLAARHSSDGTTNYDASITLQTMANHSRLIYFNSNMEARNVQYGIKATGLTHGTTPSSNTNSTRFVINDSNADEIASFNARFLTDGREGFEIRTSKQVSGITDRVYNSISCWINQSGVRSYGLSDPSAFRDTLDINSSKSLSGTNAFTVNSNATLTAAYIRYSNVKVCTIFVKVKLKAKLAIGGTRTIGSIVAGYRPAFDFRLDFGGITGMTGYINSNGVITVGNSTGAEISANSEFYCTGTYVSA